MKTLYLLSMFLFNPPLAAQAQFDKFDWKQSPSSGTWVALSPERYFWDDAAIQAEAMGGNLLFIKDAAQDSWLRTEFLTPMPADFVTSANEYITGWIGLSDRDSEGMFEWLDGAPLVYSGWKVNSPGGSPNPDYDYVCFYERPSLVSLGWFDWARNPGSIGLRGFFELPFDPTLDSDLDGLLDAHEDWDHDGLFEPQVGETDPFGSTPDSTVLAPLRFFSDSRPCINLLGGQPNAAWFPFASLSGNSYTEVVTGIVGVSLAAPIYSFPVVLLDAGGNGSATLGSLPQSLVGTTIWLDGITVDTGQIPFQFQETPEAIVTVEVNPVN